MTHNRLKFLQHRDASNWNLTKKGQTATLKSNERVHTLLRANIQVFSPVLG